MSRTTAIREVVFASKDNQAIYATGQALYSNPSSQFASDSVILVNPGQWVFVNTDTGQSVGPEATKTNTPNIAIGLAIDLDGDGISDFIRWAYDSISGCSGVSHSATPANCGVANITDVMFSCIECGQTYTLEVHVFNPDSEAFGLGYAGSDIYSFSYTVPCGDCTSGDCPETTVSADQLMCGLYNTIKGINVDPNWDIRLNRWPIEPNYKYPFDVAQLYNANGVLATTYEFCLNETDGECVDCVNFTDIGGFSTTLGDLDVTFSPVTYVTENEVKVSKRAHLERVANLITTSLDGHGTATYLPPTGNCCSHKLEINTCYTDFVLNDGDGAPISTCGTSNPFSAITVYNECQDCDNANTTTTYTAGLRFYSKAVQGKCDCIPGNQALAEYFSELEVYPKLGFAEGGAKVIVKQNATIAEGQGFAWQGREIEALRRYSSEDFVYGNSTGRYGVPALNDRLSHITTNCRDSYCIITQKVAPEMKHSIAGERWFPPAQVTFLIPTGDTVTRDSFLATYNAYFSGGACGLGTLSCA